MGKGLGDIGRGKLWILVQDSLDIVPIFMERPDSGSGDSRPGYNPGIPMHISIARNLTNLVRATPSDIEGFLSNLRWKITEIDRQHMLTMHASPALL